ncbi:phosphoribosylamine--glycine ligase [Bremerella cremea]|uniref:phosphoribosylamine--glycine ligase n=1 Tax=Bremerella cremea TaxID=1031537 RepID=UPI0031EDFF15
MNVLVLGSGGREHALAWKLSQSSRVRNVFVAPGNAGTQIDAENIAIPETDFPALVAFAKRNDVGLTVVGPEAPLVAGAVDYFREQGLKIFGPNKAAAQLEGSKAFCKQTLRSADVPTADYRVFREADAAARYIKDRFPHEGEDVNVVIKADGLAAGKGVTVCDTADEALEAIDQIGRQRVFGDAGAQIIIEERLDGEEASVLAITDGKTILTLPPAQDHKPAYDDDQGPNTGGMGAYSPTPLVTPQVMQMLEEKVLVPTVHGMKRARNPFQGVLYAGLMMTNQGPKVLEYNVRFGDPECQPILMRLKSDLADILEACAEGRLDSIDPPEWDTRPAVCVVMASEGYPGNYEKGKPIRGLEEAAKLEDVKVFHAGTKFEGEQIVTNGGRVLGVTAIGDTISAAKLKAYTAVKCIRWDGAWCRKDISDKALRHS